MWSVLVRAVLLVFALGAATLADADARLQHGPATDVQLPVSAQEPYGPEKHYRDLSPSQLRLLRLAHHGDEALLPDYVLAHEVLLPPAPQLAVGYRVAFSPALDWSLNARAPPSRLGGWKESNLTYRLAQRALSFA